MDLLCLPKDLLGEILLCVPLKYLGTVCMCCRHFRRLLSNNAFWRQRFLTEFPDKASLFEGEKEFTNYWLKQRILKHYPVLADVEFLSIYRQLTDFSVIPDRLDDSNRIKYITFDLLPRIFRKLRCLSGGREKLYFAVGDSDFTTRTFDQKSLYLQLGVQSNSEYVASILLALLKFLISPDCYQFTGHYLYFDCKKHISSFLETLRNEVSDRTGKIYSFELKEPLVRRIDWAYAVYCDDTSIVENTIDQVDIWTLERVEKAFYDRYK